MRHPRPQFKAQFAFLRTAKDRWAFADPGLDGFETSSEPPEGSYFWAPDYFLRDQKPFFKSKRFVFLTSSEVREALQALTSSPFSSPFDFEKLKWKKCPQSAYAQVFDELKSLFKSGELNKAVPVVIDEGEWLSDVHLKDSLSQSLLYIFDRLAELPEKMHPFFLAHNEWIFGATPETLVQKEGDLLTTQAVAGTSADFSRSLLNDPKERTEHDYVVESLERILSFYGPVVKSPTYEKVLPTLKHLVTDLKVDLLDADETCILKIALELHPTPALGGHPAKKAFEWLKSLPFGQNRRRYGAPFGFVTAEGESHLVVAIRALQVVDNKLLSIAGAGVIEESDLDKEWQEIELKKNSVFKLF